MKQHLIIGVRLTLVCILVFIVAYPALIWAVAQAAPAKGEGQTVKINGVVRGYALEGQSFTQDKYFNGRPSAAGYNAAGSAGSNKGPSNPDYLQTVKDRIDTFLTHNPGISRGKIPSDLITASGSGLDPDISLQAALVQVNRIAKLRNLPQPKVEALVRAHIERSAFNGIEKVNVLQLNIQLDQLQ